MRPVQLQNGIWQIGNLIGGGGYGSVHDAIDPDGVPGVIKLVPKDPGADRELLFEALGGTPNVVPILDSGEDRMFWVLAMPRASMSLRDYLRSVGGPIAAGDAIQILSDIVTALQAISGQVVHRDVKPENVLLLDGAWCLADFWIARYAEASTATRTREFSMTSPYAAPEQWRMEHATGATDVYALGVLAHEMLAGVRPFPGPREADYRDQHLSAPAPGVSGVPVRRSRLWSWSASSNRPRRDLRPRTFSRDCIPRLSLRPIQPVDFRTSSAMSSRNRPMRQRRSLLGDLRRSVGRRCTRPHSTSSIRC